MPRARGAAMCWLLRRASVVVTKLTMVGHDHPARAVVGDVSCVREFAFSGFASTVKKCELRRLAKMVWSAPS